MHDALFARQAEWSELSDPAAFLESLAVALGVDAASYRACLANGDAAAAVRRSLADAQALGYSGTPNFRFIAAAGAMAAVEGAQPLTRFTEVIDALLAGKEPPAEPAPERAPLPLWATPRGLAPDPARPGYDVAGDAYKGSPQAKVFVVEFTDFQCPACRKHATEVQPALDAEWVKSGRVLWVSKHLPLRMHAQAVLAAVAAECAGEQGRYWEMHDRLFAHQDDWSGASAETSLPGLARQLGLDPQRFQQCFDGRKALERVLADLYDAQGIVDRVPTFVVLTGGPTGTATGPLPAEGFGKLLQQAQSEAQAAAAAAKAPPDPKH